MNEQTSVQALERAVNLVGGQTALAKYIGKPVKQGHVWNWIHRDKKAPGAYCIAICRATNGQVSPHELRPDIYPDPDWLPSLNTLKNEGQRSPATAAGRQAGGGAMPDNGASAAAVAADFSGIKDDAA